MAINDNDEVGQKKKKAEEEAAREKRLLDEQVAVPSQPRVAPGKSKEEVAKKDKKPDATLDIDANEGKKPGGAGQPERSGISWEELGRLIAGLLAGTRSGSKGLAQLGISLYETVMEEMGRRKSPAPPAPSVTPQDNEKLKKEKEEKIRAEAELKAKAEAELQKNIEESKKLQEKIVELEKSPDTPGNKEKIEELKAQMALAEKAIAEKAGRKKQVRRKSLSLRESFGEVNKTLERAARTVASMGYVEEAAKQLAAKGGRAGLKGEQQANPSLLLSYQSQQKLQQKQQASRRKSVSDLASAPEAGNDLKSPDPKRDRRMSI